MSVYTITMAISGVRVDPASSGPVDPFFGLFRLFAVPSTLRHGSFGKGPQMSELNSRPKDVKKTSKTGKRDRLF